MTHIAQERRMLGLVMLVLIALLGALLAIPVSVQAQEVRFVVTGDSRSNWDDPSDVITMARMRVQASTMAVHLIGISYVVRA